VATPLDGKPQPPPQPGAAPAEPKAAPKDPPAPAFWDRLKSAFSGKPPEGWFGPGTPVRPQAQTDAHGRQFDYPFAVNQMLARPRAEPGEGGIDYPTLRRMADPALGGLDLLRIVIETRKDQMAAQKWAVRPRDKMAGPEGKKRAKELEHSFRRPDAVQTFTSWQRQLVEDLLVIDAPTIYLRPTPKAGFRLPEVVDGATIKRLLDGGGRTPLPPDPAYRQIIKGMPATDYTLDELIYAPRNPRPNRIYGMSPVEQVIGIVNVALRRQFHLLSFYTEGNVPEALITVPESWNMTQIAEFQAYWDSLLEGNLAERRHAKFVPGGTNFINTKEGVLKDEADEWIARIIAFAFSCSPQALVKEMNRATAETSKESALAEGLEPLKIWFKDVADDVLDRGFEASEFEWAWNDEEISDALVKAQVGKILVDGGILEADEVRVDMYGKEPFTAEQKAARMVAQQQAMAGAFGGKGKDDPSSPEGGGGGDGSGDGKSEGGTGDEQAARRPPPPAFGGKDGADTRKLAALIADELKKKSYRPLTSTPPKQSKPSE
jgi:hypothetical protein